MLTHTVDLQYSLVHMSNFVYWLKCNSNPQIDTLGTLAVILRHMQDSKNFEPLAGPACLQLRANGVTLCLLVSVLTLETSVLFVAYVVSCFWHSCAFCW